MATAVPATFTVVALIAAFNEEDVIDQVVTDLIDQGIAVYLIDDGSTDQTVAAVMRHLGRGLLQVERREPTTTFDWSALLARKEQLARDLTADWFLHQDADEFRESPWADMGLREALWQVDRLGYNAVDFKVLNFRPTSDQPPGPDVRASMRFYELAHDWDAVQVKAWRKQPTVDLTSLGGHEAGFDGRRIFPTRFLSRHYPIRSQSHGTRKVFAERRPRFSPRERERGWHVQYDAMAVGTNFVRSASDLLEFDPVEVRAGLALEHRELESLTSELVNERREHARRIEEAHQQCLAASSELVRAREDVATGHRLLEAERARLNQDVATANGLLEAKRDEVAKLQADLAANAARHAELERRMSASSQAASRLEEQTAFVQNRLREYAAEAARAQGEVQALRKSRSWQITAPLRAIYQLGLRSGPVPADAQPARLRPVSDQWGVDRGVPVDRYYIEQFLRAHRGDVRGRVLEVKDSWYARMLDDGQVRQIDVLDVDATNPNATVTADLARADNLEDAQFDCFILTQTLHIIYDIRSALGHATRLLRPGGVLLCTVPAVSRVNYENGGLESGDYWRLTQAAVRRLFEEFLPATSTEITTYGNVAVCSAFLYGLAATEIPPADLEFSDPWFPLIHCVRAVKG